MLLSLRRMAPLRARQGLGGGESAAVQPCEAVLSSPELLSEIFDLLPPDARLLCRRVCKVWRQVLRNPERWAMLDFMHADYDVGEALLEAAGAAAGPNGVRTLVVTNPFMLWDDDGRLITELSPVLLLFLRANAASLRTFKYLRHDCDEGWIKGDPVIEHLAAILEAVPALELLEAHAHANGTGSLLPILRDERVRIHSLKLHSAEEANADQTGMHEFVTALSHQRRTLQRLDLSHADVHLASEAFSAVLSDCPFLVKLSLSSTGISCDLLAGLGLLLSVGLLQSLKLD